MSFIRATLHDKHFLKLILRIHDNKFTYAVIHFMQSLRGLDIICNKLTIVLCIYDFRLYDIICMYALIQVSGVTLG